MYTFLSPAAAMLYLAGSYQVGRALWQTQAMNTAQVMALGTAAILLHLLALVPQIHSAEGLDLSLFHVFSLLSWLVAVLTLLLSLYRPMISLAALAFPLAAVALLGSQFIIIGYHPIAHLSRADEAHILLSILAYGLLSLAAAMAVVLHYQNLRLKQRQPLPMGRLLPPLQTLEDLLFDVVFAGWVLLTVAISVGLSLATNLRAQHLLHKTVFSIAAWLLFAFLLAGRHHLGWRGPRSIRLTLIGFTLLIVGFFGSKAVLEIVFHVN